MVHRKTVPAHGNCGINLTTEDMNDGSWRVVVSVIQSTDTAERVVDLPISPQRFATEADAEAYGLGLGREWIDRNSPQME